MLKSSTPLLKDSHEQGAQALKPERAANREVPTCASIIQFEGHQYLVEFQPLTIDRFHIFEITSAMGFQVQANDYSGFEAALKTKLSTKKDAA